jgi:hypothetical protein
MRHPTATHLEVTSSHSSGTIITIVFLLRPLPLPLIPFYQSLDTRNTSKMTCGDIFLGLIAILFPPIAGNLPLSKTHVLSPNLTPLLPNPYLHPPQQPS